MKDNLEHIFKNLEHQFDVEEPTMGHFDRFQKKLTTEKSRKNPFKIITTIAVAVSVILFVGVWIGTNFSNKGMELAKISTEMEETQSYFVLTIQKELETIEKERDSDTENVINDGLEQLKRLEKQYNALTLELKESTGDKRIIFAMISNFQQRIDILQSILIQIKNVKKLKTQHYEKYV